jgi:RNA polymerase sigma-70 factor (ECF subfamily)
MIATGAERLFFGSDALATEPPERLPRVPWYAKIIHRKSSGEKQSPDEAEICAERCEISATSMTTGIDGATFEQLVEAHYEGLYRFAFSLTQGEADARDLVQDTFVQFARKGDQLKSKSKAKSWLFTTLYRAFIDGHRRETRHPMIHVDSVESDLPVTEPEVGIHADAETVQEALMQLDEVFRVPLVLFYLEEHSYLEIAEILNIPPGTVMSRISRGRAMLRRIFEEKELVPAGHATSRKGVSS